MVNRTIFFCFLIFTIVSCHYKVVKNDNNVNDNITAIHSNKKNIFYLTASDKTIIEKYNTNKKEIINSIALIELNDLHLQFSSNKFCLIKTELVNNTNDSIFLSNDMFLYYNEESNLWRSLSYPENFVKEDLGTFIPSNTKQYHAFFFPINEKKIQGKYKLQLSFYTTSGKTHYYISKIFTIKSTSD